MLAQAYDGVDTFVAVAFQQCCFNGSMAKETAFVSRVYIDREVCHGLALFIVQLVIAVIQFTELQPRSRERAVQPCVVGCIVLHEDVDEANADGYFTNNMLGVLKMSFVLHIVVHPLELLLFQCDEVTVIPIVVIGQQAFVGMDGTSSFLVCQGFMFFDCKITK